MCSINKNEMHLKNKNNDGVQFVKNKEDQYAQHVQVSTWEDKHHQE